MSSLFIVSNRLPLQDAAGGLISGLREVFEQENAFWVGYAGSSQLRDPRLVNVPIPEELYQLYYNTLSNQNLWPVFHYFPSHMRFSQEAWNAYEEVNQRFAAAILARVQDNDQVWVHDYHVMLLPKILRQARPSLKIAYFHHVPFPSADIFRVLPMRKELLEGLLGATLIGFHAFEYVHNFLASVARLQGHDIHVDEVYLSDRVARVGAFPIGADVTGINIQLRKLDQTKRAEQLASDIGTPLVFLGVDRLDYTKGIPERMKAFYQFLHNYPDYVGKVTLIQICVPTRTEVPVYHALKAEVERLVSEINGTFGRPGYSPIHYLYKSLPFDELVLLYKIAQVALVTPLRDGLNLVAKEYVAAKEDLPEDPGGVLILSEFAGASIEMGEALRVNPYDIRDTAEKMYQAAAMSVADRKERMNLLRTRVQTNDSLAWSRGFLAAWAKAESDHGPLSVQLSEEVQSKLFENLSASNRLFVFCDNDGTLIPIRAKPDLAIPDLKTLSLLRDLSQIPFLNFTLVTGRPRSYCEKYFGNLAIDIFAEHGGYYRSRDEQVWKVLVPAEEYEEIKKEILPILNTYVTYLPGSHVETKELCLVWHFRQAEPYLADLQAKALLSTLQQLLQNTSYSAYLGKKLVEVRSRTATKGHAVNHVLAQKNWTKGEGIVTIGDDVTDEEMYRIMPNDNCSIHVGRPHFKAQYYVQSPREVLDFLRGLVVGWNSELERDAEILQRKLGG